MIKGELSGQFALRTRSCITKIVTYRAVAHVLPGLNLSIFADDTVRVHVEPSSGARADACNILKACRVTSWGGTKRNSHELHDQLRRR